MISREGILELQGTCPVFADRLAAYRDVFAAYVLQSLACALAHGAHERLARLLLQLQDRTSSANIALTHDALAAIVGTSRPTMSLLVRSFETANLVNTRRGGVTVVDRDGLERNACSCYRVTSDLFDKVGSAAPGGSA
jgi:CRP-like cAMP-binding protein